MKKFNKVLETARNKYLGEEMDEVIDPVTKQEREQLKKLDSELRKETLKKKKRDLTKVKKLNQQSNGSAL